MTEDYGLGIIPGTIDMICPACDGLKIASRMEIDPPRARLLFFPCCEVCAKKSSIEDVIYTTASREVVPL